MNQNTISAGAEHKFQSEFNHKYGFRVLQRTRFTHRRKGCGIQTRAIRARHRLCEIADAQAGNGKRVRTTAPTCRSATVGDSDVSKGATTQRRRKKNRFLAGQKRVEKEGCDVKKYQSQND